MFTFSLNTFLKICLLDTGGRISEIQKKLDSSGGYDFYWSFQKATKAKFSDSSKNEFEQILLTPTKGIEREHNRSAFNAVQEKFGTIRSIEHVSEKKLLRYKNEGIEINVDPLFKFEKSEQIKTYSVWSTKKPVLSQKYGALACYIMREAYKASSLANSQFFFFDTTSNKTYSEKQINNNTSLIFKEDLRSISTLLRDL